MHTGRGHNAPGFVHKHILLVTRMTHPFVTLDEKIATLPVLIRVRGVTYEPQQRAPKYKVIHAP